MREALHTSEQPADVLCSLFGGGKEEESQKAAAQKILGRPTSITFRRFRNREFQMPGHLSHLVKKRVMNPLILLGFSFSKASETNPHQERDQR